MVASGEMLEHAEVFGNLYGTPRAPVEAAVARGEDVLFDVDWQGGQQIRASDLREAVVSIFILPPSIAALEARLHARGQDTPEVVARRMATSRDEISHWAEYDYVLVNENLKQCEEELRAIIAAERLRRDRRPELVELVRAPQRRVRGAADDGTLCAGRNRAGAAGGRRLLGGARRAADWPGRLEPGASVWFNAVLRGDNEPIVVGRGYERAGRLRLPHRLRLPADDRRRLHHRPHGDPARLHRRRRAASSAWARRCRTAR